MLGFAATAESGVKVSSRILERYVLRGEQVEVATRQHWAKLFEPVATVLVGFVVVAWVSSGLERAFGELGLYLWWVWFGLIARMLWNMLEWRNEWFVATDKRLLLTYGLVTHKVAMMPLGKVTDLNYGRSITGRFLGYGTFTLESAGQDQALRQINWLPDPDETYRRICDIIFGPARYDAEDSLEQARRPLRGTPAGGEPGSDRYTSGRIAAEFGGERLATSGAEAAPEDVEPNDPVELDDLFEPDDPFEPDPFECEDAVANEDDVEPEDDVAPEDVGWETSRESTSTFQTVTPRTARGPAPDVPGEDDDITGPIPRPTL